MGLNKKNEGCGHFPTEEFSAAPIYILEMIDDHQLVASSGDQLGTINSGTREQHQPLWISLKLTNKQIVAMIHKILPASSSSGAVFSTL